MRSYEERIKRYEEKLERYFSSPLKEEMVNNYKRKAKILVVLDEIVNKVLTDYPINIGANLYYAFTRELYKLKRKYINNRLEKEMEICFQKWLMRGLEKEIILKIKEEIDRLQLGE
ncbi:MAG: hypothetical protein N2323_00445 [candidate division WOR-3 bacterium]|nr:hypothetical protein [candidate division WOR-3 bacterium]MCX7836415.1 hypothetical protein [candidate division WOR-3 bacterium]MDW8113732.1 hypothetical protein [candidate division WOR-3 bacterium]